MRKRSPSFAAQWRKLPPKMRGRVLDRLFGRIGADGFVAQTPYNEALEIARCLLNQITFRGVRAP